MKKILFLSVCLLAMPALAQRTVDCALTPLQNLIVNARSASEIQALISRGVVFDEQVRCGGSLMQLAIRRGNPDVLEAILRQDQNRANGVAVLDAFPILGAPKQIPLILFAAYYAPNKQIVDLLVAAGANISVTDDFGRNLLWYLNKNPVLRKTELEDDLNNKLLYSMVAQGNSGQSQQQGQQQAASAQQQPQQQGITNPAANNAAPAAPAADSNAGTPPPPDGNLVSE